METKEKVELSSHCTCTEYDEATGDSKLDAEGYPIPASDCIGCWDDAVELYEELILKPWLELKKLDLDDEVAVYFKGVSWQSVAGKAKVPAKKLLDSFTFNGDFTLYFERSGSKLTMVRTSHDEHGASFKFLKH
jgi:hypothetical protein